MTFSLIAMLCYAAVIVVARRRADVSMAPATCLSQLLVFAVFAPFAHVTEPGLWLNALTPWLDSSIGT